MDLNQLEQFRAKRLEKLKANLDDLVRGGLSAEAAASLLVATMVGDVAMELHVLEGRLEALQTALTKKT